MLSALLTWAQKVISLVGLLHGSLFFMEGELRGAASLALSVVQQIQIIFGLFHSLWLKPAVLSGHFGSRRIPSIL
jgi:hypothetical protein